MGGDIRVIGPQPQGEPWPIRIQHPRFRDRKLTQFNLTGGALASSGDYERYVEINGERYSHILSPVTGWPVKGLAAVTVVAEQCVVAGSACTIAMLKEGDGPGWLSELGAPHIWMDTQLNSGGLGPGSAA
jgi:thiamine biosynthesis lipoprotein